MSKPVFWEKYEKYKINLLSTEYAQMVVKFNSAVHY